MLRVAVIGGGVSGLATAYFLQKSDEKVEVALFDSGKRLGGKVQTDEIEGCVIEGGADSILLRKDSALNELINELGLQDELITPSRKSFAIQREGELHEVPIEMLRGFPSNVIALWRCSLFSVSGKIAGTLRPLLHAASRRALRGDPSIAHSLRKRFGKEVSTYLFETVFGGIHSGDATRLSFRSLYPDMAGVRKKRKSKYMGARFVSFRRGMSSLIDALSGSLKEVTTIQANISKIMHAPQGGYDLHIGGAQFHFDVVVIATPSCAAASLVEPLSEGLCRVLKTIRHASSAIATLILPKSKVQHLPRGSGYLLTSGEEGCITGCTYSSEKWEGRGTEEMQVVRVFFGRNGGVEEMSDETLVRVACAEVQEKLGFLGGEEHVVGGVQLKRWKHGLPQYECGHEEKLREIESALRDLPALYLTGTSYRGVGIPDCIEQAYKTVQSLRDDISEGKIVFDSMIEREERAYG